MFRQSAWVFAYSSDTSLNNIVKKIDEFNSNIAVCNRLSIVCVLDKGLIFGINKYGFKEIEIVPTDNTILVTHEDKLENNLYLFYLLMMTAINNIVMPPVNLMGYAEKLKKADYSGTVSNDRIIPNDAYLDIGNGIHSNINLMKKVAINSIPKFQNFQKGKFTKDEFIEFMATIIYQCVLDPNFTGNTIENPYQPINFFDINITSNEIIIIKKYYYNEITDIKEKEDADTLISTLFERYKEKTSN